MPAAAWILILYFVIDRLCHVGSIGRQYAVTPASALLSLITGAGAVWCVLDLAGVA